MFCSHNENGICNAEEITLEYLYRGEAPQCVQNDDYRKVRGLDE
jgi:hypothetical protein